MLQISRLQTISKTNRRVISSSSAIGSVKCELRNRENNHEAVGAVPSAKIPEIAKKITWARKQLTFYKTHILRSSLQGNGKPWIDDLAVSRMAVLAPIPTSYFNYDEVQELVNVGKSPLIEDLGADSISAGNKTHAISDGGDRENTMLATADLKKKRKKKIIKTKKITEGLEADSIYTTHDESRTISDDVDRENTMLPTTNARDKKTSKRPKEITEPSDPDYSHLNSVFKAYLEGR